eukprot:TRINITY_DN27223_c0_g2_i1.p1 TRINITY_DN27223_c0_g2~~TRINITY_DN27223_c0_g2_i1.p1  ORF type:complete len:333 (+),score=44.10 TRINITY_DN27223_c0_g2_i1:60-1058(+)
MSPSPSAQLALSGLYDVVRREVEAQLAGWATALDQREAELTRRERGLEDRLQTLDISDIAACPPSPRTHDTCTRIEDNSLLSLTKADISIVGCQEEEECEAPPDSKSRADGAATATTLREPLIQKAGDSAVIAVGFVPSTCISEPLGGRHLSKNVLDSSFESQEGSCNKLSVSFEQSASLPRMSGSLLGQKATNKENQSLGAAKRDVSFEEAGNLGKENQRVASAGSRSSKNSSQDTCLSGSSSVSGWSSGLSGWSSRALAHRVEPGGAPSKMKECPPLIPYHKLGRRGQEAQDRSSSAGSRNRRKGWVGRCRDDQLPSAEASIVAATHGLR